MVHPYSDALLAIDFYGFCRTMSNVRQLCRDDGGRDHLGAEFRDPNHPREEQWRGGGVSRLSGAVQSGLQTGQYRTNNSVASKSNFTISVLLPFFDLTAP